MGREPEKKDIGKAYEKYVSGFTPKPEYFKNSARAFITGGAICAVSLKYQDFLIGQGIPRQEASIYVTVSLIAAAQILTGLGVFDVIARFAGAGVIVPITGFANSMAAPGIEYKKEGPVLGVGSKMFSVAGPVLVCGISCAMVIGLIYWAAEAIL